MILSLNLIVVLALSHFLRVIQKKPSNKIWLYDELYDYKILSEPLFKDIFISLLKKQPSISAYFVNQFIPKEQRPLYYMSLHIVECNQEMDDINLRNLKNIIFHYDINTLIAIKTIPFGNYELYGFLNQILHLLKNH